LVFWWEMAGLLLRPQYRVAGAQRRLGAYPGIVDLRDGRRRHGPAPGLELAARHVRGIAEVVARWKAPRLLRASRGKDVACAPAGADGIGDVADRLRRCLDGQPDRAHVGPGLKLLPQFVTAKDI